MKYIFGLMDVITSYSIHYTKLYDDIIPENSHFVEKCVKITNLNDYPDVSLIGYIYGIMPSRNNFV